MADESDKSDETSRSSSEGRKAVVVLLILIVLAGVAWAVWLIRMGSETPPEKAKAMAKNAERECVLDGMDPARCEKLVGRHHRDCLEVAERKTDGIAINEKAYISCFREAIAGGEEGEDDGDDT